MNVIDLEILIPASPEFIWRFIGDLSVIPQWHDEVLSVSFLSTQREGRGTRWRHATVKGNDVIVEISAWYDRLGYEYRLVDGTSYSQNQGRIRLQEVTDGTLVRWTFQYEPGGVLGGLRNAMRHKRSASNQIQDSLRNLHQLIAQESGGISTHEAKANMQAAPDVHERSLYQPRHPSAFHDADEAAADDTTLSERFPLAYDLDAPLDPEPAPAETDTKPNPVVLGVGDDALPGSAPEPELEDTQPVEAEALLADMPPLEVGSPPAERAAPLPEPPPLSDEAQRAAPAPPSSPPRDASHLSVFEIFGLQKPSESSARAERAGEPLYPDQSGLPSQEARLSAPGDNPALGGPDRLQPAADGAKAACSSRDRSVISGWRRSARRRKTLIRSHT